MNKFYTQNEIFGDAKWIAPTDSEICPIIRRDFDIDEIESARLDIIGFSTFVFYINGVRGSEDYFLPLATDYEHRGSPKDEVTAHRTYVTNYDITALLHRGRNSIAVLLGDGWYTGHTGLYKEVPYGKKKLCFKITVKTKKSEYFVFSDLDAVWRECYIKKSDLNFGEEQDYSDWSESYLSEQTSEDWKSVCYADPPDTRYQYTDCPPDRVIEEITPDKIWERDGVTMFDAGKNLTGFPSICTEGYAGEIEVLFSEAMDEEGNLHPRSTHSQRVSYKVRGERRILEPAFTWFGFRYFTVKGEYESVTVKRINCDIDINSHFECDAPTLNWLYNAYALTQLSNMHQGITSDCPHIERRGYLGDGHLACRSAMIMLDAQKFYKKWLGDISDCQDRISGHVQYTAPYTRSGGGPGTFSHGFVKIPYEYYRRYNDSAPLLTMYPQMWEYVRYLEEHSKFDLVVSDKAGEWCLGEWCTPAVQRGDFISISDALPGDTFIPPAYANTCYYVKTLLLMIKIAGIVGKSEDIPRLTRLVERKKEVITAAFFNPNNGNFIGNFQGGNAFALDIGLGDERTKINFIAYYEANPYFDTGIYGTEMVPRLLFEYGRGDIACSILTAESPRGYGDWRKQGATTTWEYWKNPRSRSHPMYGSPTVLLFEYVLGIRHTELDSGYRRVTVEPALNTGVNRASGYITVDGGRISVNYSRSDGEATLEVSVPIGVEAQVVLGGEKILLENGGDTVLKAKI